MFSQKLSFRKFLNKKNVGKNKNFGKKTNKFGKKSQKLPVITNFGPKLKWRCLVRFLDPVFGPKNSFAKIWFQIWSIFRKFWGHPSNI